MRVEEAVCEWGKTVCVYEGNLERMIHYDGHGNILMVEEIRHCFGRNITTTFDAQGKQIERDVFYIYSPVNFICFLLQTRYIKKMRKTDQ